MPPRVRLIAICWCIVAPTVYVADLLRQTQKHLTNGAGRPFGDDFINYWSAAWLAWHRRAAEIYAWNAFHAFETSVAGASIDFYHYSYPPVLLVLTAPLAAVPYVPGLFVWLVSGWLAFYAALRTLSPKMLLLALATPALFINAVGGQNGTWTAAFLGGGLSLLPRQPVLAGVLFGLLTYKPQIGLLVPFALAAGGYWSAIGAAVIIASALVAASVLLFGFELWPIYIKHTAVLRQLILEDGSGVWHRMLSVFVTARRLGADVATAYVVQAVAALACAVVVIAAWWSNAPTPAKNALLGLGTCLATPYLQDYDLVFGTFIAVWVISVFGESVLLGWIVAGAILLLPFVSAGVARLTGVAVGPFVVAPAFILVAVTTFSSRPCGLTHRGAAIR